MQIEEDSVKLGIKNCVLSNEVTIYTSLLRTDAASVSTIALSLRQTIWMQLVFLSRQRIIVNVLANELQRCIIADGMIHRIDIKTRLYKTIGQHKNAANMITSPQMHPSTDRGFPGCISCRFDCKKIS